MEFERVGDRKALGDNPAFRSFRVVTRRDRPMRSDLKSTSARNWSRVKRMAAAELQAAVREAILDGIERLLARYGYKKTTMDDLAREAGIGKGTIYLYFPSKEEVAASAPSTASSSESWNALQRTAASGGPAGERIRRMLVERVMIRIDSVRNYSQSLDDLFESLRPAYMARRSQYFARETTVFGQVLLEGHRAGDFCFSDAQATAHTLLLATNSLLPYSLSVRELGEREEITTKIERLSDMLLNGLYRRESRECTGSMISRTSGSRLRDFRFDHGQNALSSLALTVHTS